MANKMLIDATHPEETRVVVLRGNRVEEFDFESANRKQLRGNIYLAKVTRVEPSLQAAFVDYGGNRHGFLAFSEIHPDYYQIPVADRQALIGRGSARPARRRRGSRRSRPRSRRHRRRGAHRQSRGEAQRTGRRRGRRAPGVRRRSSRKASPAKPRPRPPPNGARSTTLPPCPKRRRSHRPFSAEEPVPAPAEMPAGDGDAFRARRRARAGRRRSRLAEEALAHERRTGDRSRR